MGRRKKGRAVHGWVVIDKPAGQTSNAVVTRVRRAFDAKKAGHAGTLDPAATGVLAIALGEATKTVPYVQDASKRYRFDVRWGAATDTDDAEGRVVETSDSRPSREEIEAALPAFIGDIMQVPPAYSAVKVDGQRAYDLARSGEETMLEARSLNVERLDLVDYPDRDTATLEMVCGKGGYVRSIARDLGQALGCLGHVLRLNRVWSGPFQVDQALALEDLEAADDPDALLLPLAVALTDLPEARCSDLAAQRLRNGNPGEITHTTAAFGEEAWASHAGEPVAIGTYRGGLLHPTRVFVW